jgi:hypothetical protein
MKFILVLLISVPSVLNAQAYLGLEKTPTQTTLKAANCVPPRSSTMMEANNVRALIHTAGNLWQIPGQNLATYEVPKNSGIHALFTSALWLGGTDVNGQLKLAALRYREGQDYWTGPLSIGYAVTESAICSKYDKHFVTQQDYIKEFDAWYEAGIADQKNGTKNQQKLFPNYKIPDMIKNWPAHGDPSLGQDYYLAPFYDRDNDGTYQWEQGDYPWYDFKKQKECSIDRKVSLYGDKNFWWVMNDKGNIHTETGADPIGMEIRAQAFVFATNDEINSMTFYNYELINRGTQTLTNTYFGMFVDGALGDPFDDFVGCDVKRGLGYVYNGDQFDGPNLGFKGYGYTPPAVGVDFFEGPYQDNDGKDNAFGIGANEALNGIGYGDGVIDNERFGMRRFLYYVNTGSTANENTTDPIKATDYYNYLRGYWKDNTPFYYGGSGHFSDPDANQNMPCDFMFPGDTDPLGWGTKGIPQLPWTEETAGNTPYDRRFLQSAGPFILKPGAVNNITVGIAWARATSGGPFSSVNTLKIADDKAQSLFENCFKVLEAPHAPEMIAQELSNQVILLIQNAPNSNNYNEQYEEIDPFIVTENPTDDNSYNFQGYIIYQVKDASVSASELEDVSKARVVAQCDIKDEIGDLINFEFDSDLNASIPVRKVKAENKGIQHSFSVTEDLFSTGDVKTLVNFKTYYFIAIAYSHNNYKTYTPNDPNNLDGQKKPFLGSRKSVFGEVKTIEAIPHRPALEKGGTNAQMKYGDGPEITRYDGRGNGNLAVDLVQTAIDQIVANGKADAITYARNAGPIKVKVVDPLNVAPGYFELKFRNYVNEEPNEAKNGKGIDTSSWVVYRYDQKGGTILDSVSSDRTISRNKSKEDSISIAKPDNITFNSPQSPYSNEQLVPEWGVSIQIYQERYFKYKETSSSLFDKRYTRPIEATVSFDDSTENWLSFIEDDNNFSPRNWIRSGIFEPDATACQEIPTVYDPTNPCYYLDEVDVDLDYNYSKLLNGGIAPFRLVGFQGPFMPFADPFSTGSKSTQLIQGQQRNTINKLPNIDIVFTSDKTKWTRCPVIELGRDQNLTIGEVKAGTLRASQSVGKDGKPDGTGTGLGWFPGYAIDVETGVRLHMAFGENSFLGKDNGADMLWNPTSNLGDPTSSPILGGQHAIYVFGFNISGDANDSRNCPYYDPKVVYNEKTKETNSWVYNKYKNISSNNYVDLYANLSWVCNPILTFGKTLLKSNAKIRVRVNKEYNDYVATNLNEGKPMYGWSMDDLATMIGSSDVLKESLALINVVPNPYYAYSEYERSKIDTRVKIINLPEKCTIKIYNISGKLIKTFKKESPITFQDWNLVNEKTVPVASGIYLIHVEVPDIGERILKLFVSQRAADLEGF